MFALQWANQAGGGERNDSGRIYHPERDAGDAQAPRRLIRLADRDRSGWRQAWFLRRHTGHTAGRADQAAVTLGSTDGEISGLTISDPPTQAEVKALRDKCEELADDVGNLSTLVHALRTALVVEGLIKGGA
jgi:hypothetical protein